MKKFYLSIVLLLLAQIHTLAQYEFFNNQEQYKINSEQLTDAFNANLDSLMLDSIILAYQNSLSIPGIATLIIKDNEVVWNKNYGYRNLQYQLPVEDSTLFLMASISKTITVTAAMQLWENSMIDLNSNINNYLPSGLTVVNPYYPSDIITVKMLMTHTSTLLDNWDFLLPLISCGDSPISLDTFLINYLTPGGTYYSNANFGNYQPGQQWNYTSVGTGLLALIVGNLSGKSFDEYCRDSIFIPLSMNSTSWFLEGLNTNNIAVPYVGSTPGCHQGWPLFPGAFLRTNKIDLLKFLQAYLNNGIYNNTRILDSTTISYMLSDQLGYPATYLSPWWVYGQGLIWFNAFPINISGWGHAGSWPGCLTYFCYDPIEKWGTIWFQNWRPTAQNWISSLGEINHQFTKYAHLYGNIYALASSVDKPYAKVNIDSVLFRTRFSNTYNHQFIPHLIYANLDSTLIDSLTLFDDGLHGDSLSNDGIYGVHIPIQQTENFYSLSVSTVDNQTSKYFNTPDICRFTTAGPVVLDSVSITKHWDYFTVKPFIKNQSTATLITNALVNLICNDPWISSITPATRSVANIPPGATVSPSAGFTVRVDSSFPDYFNFKVEVSSGNWPYWIDSLQVIVSVEQEDLQPLTYMLEQNYPNPFNPSTKIKYSVPQSSQVQIKVFDVLGSEVATLVNEEKNAGNYSVEFNAASIPSGVYFYQLKVYPAIGGAGDYISTKKMILLK
jgi:CubicO group peptidase (beta-lactamase class C family)